MAGVKGKSGGPRKNAGGARPGAGRKPKAPEAVGRQKSPNGRAVETRLEGQPHGGALKRSKGAPVPIEAQDMLELLQKIALGQVDATALQVKAAAAAIPYTHAKVGEGGKKERKKEAAQGIAAGGRFRAQRPPSSRSVN